MYGDADRKIEALLSAAAEIREGMAELIELCERACPSKVWTDFHGLNFEQDYQRLTQWVSDLLEEQPPSCSINGLWFGLFNPYLDDGKLSCCMYLAGSERFALGTDSPDWPCNPEYWPEDRYASSEVLTTIYRRTAEIDKEAGAQAEFALCQGYACLVVADWCRGPMQGKLLGDADFRGVAVGFDSGDIVMIDVLRQSSA